MNKQAIVNQYFTSRAFNAATDLTMTSINLRLEMPDLSSEQADKVAILFASLSRRYMEEARECAEKLGQ